MVADGAEVDDWSELLESKGIIVDAYIVDLSIEVSGDAKATGAYVSFCVSNLDTAYIKTDILITGTGRFFDRSAEMNHVVSRTWSNSHGVHLLIGSTSGSGVSINRYLSRCSFGKEWIGGYKKTHRNHGNDNE